MNLLRPNAACHNTSRYTNIDGFLEHSLSGENLYYKGLIHRSQFIVPPLVEDNSSMEAFLLIIFLSFIFSIDLCMSSVEPLPFCSQQICSYPPHSHMQLFSRTHFVSVSARSLWANAYTKTDLLPPSTMSRTSSATQ